MDNFDKRFKDKYNSEPQESFQDSDWAMFHILKAQKAKNARKKFILAFAVFFLFCSACNVGLFTYMNSQKLYNNAPEPAEIGYQSNVPPHTNQAIYQETNTFESNPLVASSDIPENYTTKSIVKQKEVNFSNNIGASAQKVLTSSHLQNVQIVYNAQNLLTKSFTDKDIQNSNGNDAFIQNESYTSVQKEYADQNDQKAKSDIDSAVKNHDLLDDFIVSTSLKEKNRKGHQIPSLRNLNQQKKKIFLLPKSFILKANAGIGLTHQITILSEKSSFNDYIVAMPVSKRIRYRLETHVNEIYYKTSTMNNSIGIRSIEAPNNDVVFNQAIAETHSMYAGLGMEFITLNVNRWRQYVGVSGGFQRILEKEIEYDFRGEKEEDDVHISLNEFDKKLRWKQLRFCTGLEYQYRRYLIFTELSYLYEFDRQNKILPNLINGSIGIGCQI